MLLLSLAQSALAQGFDVPYDFPNVADAVANAPEGATIRIAAGFGPYIESIVVDKSLVIEGLGGRPVLQPLLDDVGVFEVNNVSATLTLRGMEIDGQNRRAALVTAGQLVLEDVFVHSTYSATAGGAIQVANNVSNALAIRNSRFVGSSSGNNGGFLAVLGGNLSIENSDFTEGLGALDGGVIATSGVGDTEITGSSFLGALANSEGGILYAANQGLLTVTRSVFIQGQSLADRGGGAMYITGPLYAEIADNTFQENSALGPEGGGAVYHRTYTLYLRRNVFCANTATKQGGAVRLHGGNAEVYNNLFFFNGAERGGAVYASIQNALFSHNSASGNYASEGAVIFGHEPNDIVDSYIADSLGPSAYPGGTGSAVWADKPNEVFVSYSLLWNNVAYDLSPNVSYDEYNTLFEDAGLPPATDCDPLQLFPPLDSPLRGAGSDGSDIGAFSGPDAWPDNDIDNLPSIVDCDDNDPSIGAPAPEIAGDGLDSDCDGTELCYVDSDGDGHGEPGTSITTPNLDCNGEGEAPADDDRCPDFDDALDEDGDGLPDACDPCWLDALDDSDGDGICDSDDACPGMDDALNEDGDTLPDGCDVCPTDPLNDSDNDSVCDGEDVCPGQDDRLDTDGDGIPNGCDDCGAKDSDGDGAGDDCDVCPGSDDRADADGDGKPDGCERIAIPEVDDPSVGCSCSSSPAGGSWAALLWTCSALLAWKLRRRG